MAKKPRRPPGAGSIDELPSGKWRVRVRKADGTQVSLGTRATEAEARAVMTEAVRALATAGQASIGTMTLRAWGPTWLKSREADGIRGYKEEGYVWNRHVLGHAIADVPLRELTRKVVLAWMNDVRATPVMLPSPGGGHTPGPRTVSRRVVLHALHVLRSALHAARDTQHIATDPTLGVVPPKDRSRREQPWTFLTPAEIARVTACADIPEPERTIYAVAIYTGLRQGELWALERSDIVLDGPSPEITVSRSHDGPPKSGKVRRVPLLPEAIEALRAHLAGPHAGRSLVFPGETGGRRCRGDDARWAPQTRKSTRKGQPAYAKVNGYRLRAGLTRRVRFHDLRHTCASHLVMGTFGVTLTIQEVCAWLGHSSITVTERYAHLAPDRLASRIAAARPAPYDAAPPVSPSR